MWLFYVPDAIPQIGADVELPAEETAHCVRVLRLSEGHRILLTNGRGQFCHAVITFATQKRCVCRIESVEPQPPLWLGHLHIAVAPTKLMERNEWFVEKAVEIGVSEITFIRTAHSERTIIKQERVEKIAVSAMKQSLKATLPVINAMQDFREFVATPFDGDSFIAHCDANSNRQHLQTLLQRGRSARVMIGPEGDFSPEEVLFALEHGFREITLGPSRLRTETAAIAAVHIMNLTNQTEQ